MACYARFEAKKYINGYFEKYPGVKAYIEKSDIVISNEDNGNLEEQLNQF